MGIPCGSNVELDNPNRNGQGPMPVDLALTYNEDQNIGVGIPFTRATEFRVAYHFNDQWAFGAGIENPNQFIGNFVALPAAFTSVGSQFDNGNQIGAPNAFPDILSKLSYDKQFSRGRHLHAETVGLLTGVHMAVKPLDGTSFRSHRAVGGGGAIAANYEFSPGFRILANMFWSDGGVPLFGKHRTAGRDSSECGGHRCDPVVRARRRRLRRL